MLSVVCNLAVCTAIVVMDTEGDVVFTTFTWGHNSFEYSSSKRNGKVMLIYL